MSPLREPTFLLLTALAAGPLHGYAAIKEVVALSDDRVQLRAGTLYAALDRLTGEGLVQLDREDVVEGRLRRYSRLTDTGAAVLEREAELLRRNASAAAERLRRRPGARPATGAC